MRFLEWFYFWNWFLNRDKNKGPMGCFPFIMIFIVIGGFFGIEYIHEVLESIGLEGGMGTVVKAYLFISMWDVYSQQEVSDSLKITMFLTTIFGLLFLCAKYNFLDEEKGKYKILKLIALYGFVGPHVLLLIARIFLTILT